MSLDETAADVGVATPGLPQQNQELHVVVNDQPLHTGRSRQEVRLPTWIRDLISSSLKFIYFD